MDTNYMQLPIFKSSSSEVVEKAHFLCVILTEGAVQTSLLAVTPYAAAATVTSPIMNVTDQKDLLVKTDQALQELGPDSESVQDTIFCCSSTWVDDNGVRKEKQGEFDRLCKELSLRPLGYIVLSDVVSEHVIGMDPFITGLYFICSAHNIQVILIESGKVQAIEMVGASGKVVEDVREAFGRMLAAHPQKTKLPTTWQLVSHGLPETVLSQYQQDILEANWANEAFLGVMPVVEYWSGATLTAAIASAAGKVLARQIHGSVPAAATPKTDHHEAKTEITAPLTSMGATKTVVVEPEVVDQADSDAAEVFDQMPDQSDEPSLSHDDLAVIPKPATLSPTAFQGTELAPVDDISALLQATPESNQSHSGAKPKKWHLPGWGFWKKSAQPPKIKLSNHKKSPVPAIAAGIALGFLVVLLVLTQLAGRLSTVTVTLTPKKATVKGDFKVTLDSTLKTADPTKLLLPAQSETVSISVSGKTQATGKKEVGEMASGLVKILNKTTSEKTFNKGTVLKSDALAYELFGNVTVPAASISSQGSTGETKSYGTAQASISAQAIGDKYNLKADSTLSIADLSTSNYAATVVSGLTGGSSREVTVVAAKDRERLSAELQSEALKDAIKQFEQKSNSQRQFVPPSKVAVVGTKFDQKEGDETDVLELALTASASALSYQKSDVELLAQNVLKANLQDGEKLPDGQIQLLTKLEETTGKNVKPIVVVSATSPKWPKLDSASLSQSLAGRGVNDAKQFLKSRDDLESYDLKFNSPLAAWLAQKMPAADKIKIEIKTGAE